MKLHLERKGIALYHGDCRDHGGALGLFDSVVTDPPYHLTAGKKGGSGAASLNPNSPAGRSRIGTGFMGKAWDGGDVAFRPETWATIATACKPGAMLLAFGGTRTWHRLACAIEDGGWELRDTLMWAYGSGFPKSLDISKAIEKSQGIEFESRGHFQYTQADEAATPGAFRTNEERENPGCRRQEPTTDEGKLWDGWGTCLKPAWEPIIMAMKPLDGTFVDNALAHGVSGLNIDACRIPLNGDYKCGANGRPSQTGLGDNYDPDQANQHSDRGRFPANLILSHHPDCRPLGTRTVTGNGHHPASRGSGGISTDGHGGQTGLEERRSVEETVEAYDCHADCPVRMLDEQAGPQSSGGTPPRRFADKTRNAYGDFTGEENPNGIGGSSGAVSRFFYCAKASTSERGAGNTHPTVKPIDLMRYLCRLVRTPTAGRILDPFAGSGSTLIAAYEEGMEAVGIELDVEHCVIAEDRINRATAQGRMF